MVGPLCPVLRLIRWPLSNPVMGEGGPFPALAEQTWVNEVFGCLGQQSVMDLINCVYVYMCVRVCVGSLCVIVCLVCVCVFVCESVCV